MILIDLNEKEDPLDKMRHFEVLDTESLLVAGQKHITRLDLQEHGFLRDTKKAPEVEALRYVLFVPKHVQLLQSAQRVVDGGLNRLGPVWEAVEASLESEDPLSSHRHEINPPSIRVEIEVEVDLLEVEHSTRRFAVLELLLILVVLQHPLVEDKVPSLVDVGKSRHHFLHRATEGLAIPH